MTDTGFSLEKLLFENGESDVRPKKSKIPSGSWSKGKLAAIEVSRPQSSLNLEEDIEVEEAERRESIDRFVDKFSEEVTKTTENVVLKSQNATDAFSSSTLRKLFTGAGTGHLFETVSIFINFVQNFGLSILINIPWPASLKGIFTWVEMFNLNISIFGGAGTTSASGCCKLTDPNALKNPNIYPSQPPQI